MFNLYRKDSENEAVGVYSQLNTKEAGLPDHCSNWSANLTDGHAWGTPIVWYHLLECPILLQEGPAEFTSNLDQTHMSHLIKVFRINRLHSTLLLGQSISSSPILVAWPCLFSPIFWVITSMVLQNIRSNHSGHLVMVHNKFWSKPHYLSSGSSAQVLAAWNKNYL